MATGTTRKPRGRSIEVRPSETDAALAELEPSIHRRVLEFVNRATRHEDLMRMPPPVAGHEGQIHEDGPDPHRDDASPLLDERAARAIVAHREKTFPLGYRHIHEILEITTIRLPGLKELLHRLGHQFFGHWDTLPYDTQHPDGTSVDVGHAAMLHTGRVLFIPADYQNAGWKTPIWDPSSEATPSFEYPAADPGYSLFCGGHSFLSDGRLLVLGGGGDLFVTPTAVRGYTFEELAGDTRGFPNLYPGLHLLPNDAIFRQRHQHSRDLRRGPCCRRPAHGALRSPYPTARLAGSRTSSCCRTARRS